MIQILNLLTTPIDTPCRQAKIEQLLLQSGRMSEQLKYVIFPVRWGHFGILSTQKALLRTCLPCRSAAMVKGHLMRGIAGAEADSSLLVELQGKITAYFEGTCVNFSDVKVDLSNLSPFGMRVLSTCRKITYGHTTTYSRLAQMARSPRAARAAGNILSKNPLPLIIPCHRIIRNDGSPGGFSAPTGTKLKQKLINLEKYQL